MGRRWGCAQRRPIRGAEAGFGANRARAGTVDNAAMQAFPAECPCASGLTYRDCCGRWYDLDAAPG